MVNRYSEEMNGVKKSNLVPLTPHARSEVGIVVIALGDEIGEGSSPGDGDCDENASFASEESDEVVIGEEEVE